MNIQENPIVKQALEGGKIDMEMYTWAGCDILMLTYIKNFLDSGATPETAAQEFGVTVEGIYKFILNKS